ncbi:hypothetical protein METP3_01007 [Methanosarcinales archaeon]|nr:hypothetical protein METP3_01007 [Methanosarcinales archaeon]
MRSDSKAAEGRYRQRLDAFREGITTGANEIGARHLYRAGIYWASFDNEMIHEPLHDMIINSLQIHLQEKYPDLYSFFLRNKNTVSSQSESLEPSTMLSRILRRKDKAEGLLRASAELEINNSKRALERAEQLKERLKTWKEGINVRNKPEAICIVEQHGVEEKKLEELT